MLTLKVRCMAGFTTHVLSLFQQKICVDDKDYKLQNIVYSTGCILRTESERGSAESATERYSGLKGNLE